MSHFLENLFRPKSLAIIGASSDPDKLGGRPVAHNLEFNYSGRLLPVNASAAEVQGLKAYASIADIDGPIDCAIVSVPAAAVEAAVLACAKQGVKIAVVFSSGSGPPLAWYTPAPCSSRSASCAPVRRSACA